MNKFKIFILSGILFLNSSSIHSFDFLARIKKPAMIATGMVIAAYYIINLISNDLKMNSDLDMAAMGFPYETERQRIERIAQSQTKFAVQIGSGTNYRVLLMIHGFENRSYTNLELKNLIVLKLKMEFGLTLPADIEYKLKLKDRGVLLDDGHFYPDALSDQTFILLKDSQ